MEISHNCEGLFIGPQVIKGIMPYSGDLGAATGDKGSVFIIQAKALLGTSKFMFGAKSIMINDNALFFLPNKLHYKEIHSKLRNTNC